MAGTIIESQLTAPASRAVRFVPATSGDDGAIRRFLRDNPLGGEISLSFEREPNYFAGGNIAGADDQTILGFENGRLVGMGRCSLRDRYLNGESRRIGYLCDLRLDASARGRFDVLRRGYQFFHELHRDHPADAYFTSVTADNFRSLRFLERGLPGMPAYLPLTDFVTLLIPVPRSGRRSIRTGAGGMKIQAASEEHIPAMVELLNSHARQFNLATVWDEDKIRSLADHGLPLANFHLVVVEGKIVACGGLWDQRCFRQIVIRGYSHRLARARPWLNFAAVFGGPKLPPIGSTLAQGLLSPLAAPLNDPQCLLALIDSSLVLASRRRLDFLTLGFAAADPRLAAVRSRFRGREYVSRLFQVHWPDEYSPRIVFDEKLPFPEVALL
jgi:hypothetical protein